MNLENKVTQLDKERHVRKYTQFLLPSAGDEFRLVKNFSFISDFTAELNFVTALQIKLFHVKCCYVRLSVNSLFLLTV
jgi:hypothetical protein